MERHIRDPPREQHSPRPPVRLGNQIRTLADIIDRLNNPKRGIGLELDPLTDTKETPPKRHGGNNTAKEPHQMTSETTETAAATGQEQDQITAGDRLVALKAAYPILAATGEQPNVLDLIRLAEYIATGKDFLDGPGEDTEAESG